MIERKLSKQKGKLQSYSYKMLVLVFETVLFLGLSWPGTHYGVKVGFELITSLLPRSSKCGIYGNGSL